jgi:hypothetical protein
MLGASWTTKSECASIPIKAELGWVRAKQITMSYHPSKLLPNNPHHINDPNFLSLSISLSLCRGEGDWVWQAGEIVWQGAIKPN